MLESLCLGSRANIFSKKLNIVSLQFNFGFPIFRGQQKKSSLKSESWNSCLIEATGQLDKPIWRDNVTIAAYRAHLVQKDLKENQVNQVDQVHQAFLVFQDAHQPDHVR